MIGQLSAQINVVFYGSAPAGRSHSERFPRCVSISQASSGAAASQTLILQPCERRRVLWSSCCYHCVLQAIWPRFTAVPTAGLLRSRKEMQQLKLQREFSRYLVIFGDDFGPFLIQFQRRILIRSCRQREKKINYSPEKQLIHHRSLQLFCQNFRSRSITKYTGQDKIFYSISLQE